MQKLAPDEYAKLELPDQWIEDMMQDVEARWIVSQTREGAKVLDLGWGSGIVARTLAAASRRVTVVDGAGEYISHAVQVQGVTAIHSMFEDYHAHAKFDYAIASFILEHVADPVALLSRISEWTDRLIVVVGNAASWHRRLAVEMGLQGNLHDLSGRDRLVGHHRVYDMVTIEEDLHQAGWRAVSFKGIMFKPLPNSMLSTFDRKLVRAMCEVEVATWEAANIGIVCERV